MIKLLTLKLKIIIAFSVVIFCLLIGGYIYLNKMEVTSANLNINKIHPIDRLCNYSVFSDFYYHVVDYQNNENSFAKLTPVKTNICYNFKTNKIALVSNVNGDSIILDDNKGSKVHRKIGLLDNFQEEYSKLVATQDKDYFDTSYKLSKKTYHSLYKKDMPIAEINLDNRFYTNISNLPIANLAVNYFKLSEIKNPPKQALKDAQWQPNILEWDFGEDDRIYLQYLTKFKQDDLEDYMKDNYAKSNKTIVRLTKFNNNQLSKMFLIFDDKQNKIIALFMDNNGYVYDLILNVQNKKAFQTYFNDFMKIAYGIYFVKKDGFINKWAEEQEKAIKNLNASMNVGNEMVNKWKFLHDVLKCTDILKNYNEAKFITDFINWKDDFRKANDSVLDKKFDIFKRKYGYPTDEVYTQFYNANENLKLINNGIVQLFSFFSLSSDHSCKVLQEKCPNNLECIRNLQKNNWKEEE